MKPKPVVVKTICSECDLDWDLHGDNPSAGDCIRLLKAELAKRPRQWYYAQSYTMPCTTTTFTGSSINAMAVNAINS